MRATQANLLMFVHGNKQFQVPIYQRRYDWSEEECEKLWDAVLDAGADKSIPSYFLGSIVYIKEDNHHASSRVEQFCLIDGQQRLATVSLLLAALGEAIEKSVEIGINKTDLQHLYLFNRNVPDDNYRYKYLLTEPDKETLNRLLDHRPLPTNPSDRLLENYDFFKKKLQPHNLETVYEGITKLEIVDVLLEREKKDNPQLIFESINSTGTQLTDADLIRNYIFMGQTPDFQTRLYRDYWHRIEERFGEEFIKQFDAFIMTYLTLQTKEYLKQDDVYEKFKEMVSNKKGTNKEAEEVLEETIKEMNIYSKYYVRTALLQEDDPELLACFKDLHVLNVKTVWAFVLGVYEDYMQKQLQKSEFINLLRLIENYIVRRIICGIHTKNPRRLFVQLISGIDKSNHLESLRRAFAEMSQNTRYPSDDEFKEQFCIKDVYGITTPIRKYLLGKMEHHENNKEPVSLENCTVERVMPEKLNEEWETDLGDGWETTHALYLGRLGNLTLTGYNSELGNRSFKEKKDILRDSPLSLNQDIIREEQWDEATIINRAKNLSEKALKIWPDHGHTSSNATRTKGKMTRENYPHLTGRMMELFLQLENQILNLDASVSQSFAQRYIAFKLNNNNFVIIEPQAKGLRLSLKIPYSELFDPAHLVAGTNNRGASGLSLGSEVFLSSADHISYVMDLVIQAFEKQKAEKS